MVFTKLICTFYSIIYNNNYKTSIGPISSKIIELSGAPKYKGHLVHGLGRLIVRLQYKVHQQMIRWNGNLGRISESEKVSFQMATERNYDIWWLNMLGQHGKTEETVWQPFSTMQHTNHSSWHTAAARSHSAVLANCRPTTELENVGCGSRIILLAPIKVFITRSTHYSRKRPGPQPWCPRRGASVKAKRSSNY